MADVKLDPRAFGLAGDAISFKEYMKRLNAGISKLPKELGLYVDLVIDYLNDGKVSADDLKKALSKPSVTAYKRKILTDFGETLGPLGIVKFKLFKGADNKCLIRYPTRQNEGMYDYMMSFNGGKSWNKSLGHS